MVEAPGTAPGSDRFITMTIYRHISCEHLLYRGGRALMQIAYFGFVNATQRCTGGSRRRKPRYGGVPSAIWTSDMSKTNPTTDARDVIAQAAKRFFGKAPGQLSRREHLVLERALSQQALSRDSSETFEEKLTFGQKLADGVAAFGGSWRFLIYFAVLLGAWVVVNLTLHGAAPDPYPFIFLNLVLSMLAAVQAPVIMMSQNRQSARDRLVTSHDYEVNLKSEIEIMALHDKLDQMRNDDIKSLLARQQEQIDLLTRLMKNQLDLELPSSDSQ